MAAAKATGLIRRVMPAWAPRALTFGLIGVLAVVLAATHPHPATRGVGALIAVVLALAIVAPLLIGRRERLSGPGKALAAAYRDAA